MYTVQEEETPDSRSKQKMGPNTRLRLSVVMIVLSAIYAGLIVQDRDLAGIVAIGYIALLLTLIVLTNLWKRDA